MSHSLDELWVDLEGRRSDPRTEFILPVREGRTSEQICKWGGGGTLQLEVPSPGQGRAFWVQAWLVRRATFPGPEG